MPTPAHPPPAVQVDTSQIFPEVLNDRDKAGGQSQARLVVGSVQEDMDRGSIVGQPVPGATRKGARPTPC